MSANCANNRKEEMILENCYYLKKRTVIDKENARRRESIASNSDTRIGAVRD